MRKVAVRVTEEQYRLLEMMVQAGEYPSVSEAIRTAIRDLIDRKGTKVLERFERLTLYS